MPNNCVDILLAAYNGQKYVAEQVNSILGQSHTSLRLIIRDDNSSDYTRSILESYTRDYPEKVILLPKGDNLGAKQNFSILMKYAESPYIMFSDQDDIWRQDKVAKTLAKMKGVEEFSSPERPVLIHTDLMVADSNMQCLNWSFWNEAHLNPYHTKILNRLLVQNGITGCTMMMNRSLLKLAAPIPGEAVMHDWWIALVAAAFGTIEFIEESTLFYRQHETNVIGAKKFGGLQFFRQKLNEWKPQKSMKARSIDFEKMQQAAAFYSRYLNLFDEHQKEVLSDYLKIPHSSFLKSRYVMFKHSFFKHGFLRNTARFFLDRYS